MPLQDTPADNGGRKKIAFCYAMVFLEMFLMFTVPMNFSYYIAEMDQPYVMMGILLGLMGVAQAVFSILYTRRATKVIPSPRYSTTNTRIGIRALGFPCAMS